jgi:NRE family putative nickel resistance protein-like MFS transporter
VPPRSVHRTIAIFAVLRDRELRALWFADWISDVGNFVTFIALAVYVNRLTGSAAAVGFALALRSVPWFTIGPFAGVLADRMDRRSLMIATNLIRAVLVGALPFTHAAWQAYVLSFLSSMLGPVFRPARSALMAQLAPGERLVPALAVMETTHNVLQTIGPAIGGLTVLLVGARNAFFLDAASFVVAAAFIVTIAARARREVERRPALDELREGVRAVFTSPVIRTFTMLTSFVYFGYAGVVALLVVYVRDVLGRAQGTYGLVLSAAGLGTVMASLVMAARDDRHPRTPWAFLSAAGLGTFVLALFEPSFLWLMPIAFAMGLSDAGLGIPLSAGLAENLPDELRGRAYSAVQALEEFAAATGSVAFAWLGEPERLGAPGGLALAAAVGAGLGFAFLIGGGGRVIAHSERIRLENARKNL